MGFLGDGFNDPKSAAIMALAGNMVRGGLNGGFGGGLLAAQDAYQGQQDQALKRQYVGVQMQDMQQQIKLRELQAQQAQRQAEWMAGLLGDMNSPAPAQGSMSGPAIPPAPGGALGSGTFGMPAGGQQQFNPTTAPPSAGGGSLIQQARALGIPDMAIKSDLATNGGKGIAEMIYKRGTPDMQVNNGYAYNKNSLNPGFMPQANVSTDGKATVTTIGANGLPQTQPQAGAVDAYTQFSNAGEAAKARYDLQTVTPKGANSPVMTSRLDLLRQTQGDPAAQVPPALQQSRDAEALPYLQKDLQAAEAALTEGRRKLAPKAQLDGLQQAVDSARRELQARSSRVPGIELQPPAVAKFNESVATNEAGQVNDAYTKATAAKSALPTLWQAQEILKGGTFTGMGADAKMNVLRALGSIGIQIPETVANSQEFDATISQVAGKQLKSIVGSNGISNSDVKLVQNMFGTRGQEAKAVAYLVNKAIENNFREINAYNGLLPKLESSGGQTMLGRVESPQQPGQQANVVSELPKSAQKGARARDMTTNQIVVFNGLSWVPEKK